jgi:hypothetical protein
VGEMRGADGRQRVAAVRLGRVIVGEVVHGNGGPEMAADEERKLEADAEPWFHYYDGCISLNSTQSHNCSVCSLQ